MKVIKVVFSDKTSFIVDLVEDFENRAIVEYYNIDKRKDRKKAITMQTNFGTKTLPLIVFEDENLDEVDAIWSESDPEWESEINRILTNLEG